MNQVALTASGMLCSVASGLLVLQLIPAVPDDLSRLSAATIAPAEIEIPEGARQVLERACMDCHSGNTHWPWYAGIAPASWLVNDAIRRGRHAAEFPVQPGLVGARTLQASCDAAQSGSMPPAGYRLLHPRAALNAADKLALCEWSARSLTLFYSKGRD